MKRTYNTASLPALLALAALPVAAHELGHHHHDEPPPATPVVTGIRELVTAFRESGDDRHLDTAWQRLEPALAGDAPTPGLLLDAALVAQARHDFDDALALTHRSLEREPGNDQAWLLLASIHLVQGEADAARESCRRLRRAEPLVMMTCFARTALVSGDADAARRRLSAVLDVFDAETLPAESLAWSLSVAGDLSADGHPEAAIRYYRRSLALAERAQVRAALVDVLLEAGRLDEARHALDAGAPALPLDVRRFIVARRSGALEAQSAAVDLADRRFRGWIAAEDWLHAREMARFYLDVLPQPVLARRLATINLSLQREPEDLRLEQRTRPDGDAGRT